MFNLAVRGFLIGLLLAPVALSAQEKPEEQAAPLEQSEGAAENPPTPKDETTEKAAQKEAAPVEPLPTPTIQHERPPEPACDARCQAAEQREKDDLKAQESMADAAVRLIDVTWWQIGIAGIAVGLLIWTLKLTRDANCAAIRAAEAAEAAVEVTDKTAEHQLRAYLDIENSHANELSPGERAMAILTFQNVGQTPAYKISLWYACAITSPDGKIDWSIQRPGDVKVFYKGPSGRFVMNVPSKGPLDNQVISDIHAKKLELFFWGKVEYCDAFDKDRFISFRYRYMRRFDGAPSLFVCDEGNEAD